MEIIIRGDKIKVTDSMKDYIKEKLEKLDKYLKTSENVRANVAVKVTGKSKIIEITIPLNTVILRSEEKQDDFYKDVDKTVDKLIRQLRKNKTRMTKHTKIKNEIELDELKELESKDIIEKRKKVSVKPMSEEEAILEMELTDHEFYMFINDKDDKPSVVYKRKKGGYGIITTE